MNKYRRVILATTAGLLVSTANSHKLNFAEDKFEADFVDVDDFDEMGEEELVESPLDSMDELTKAL